MGDKQMTDEEYQAEVRRTYNLYHKPKPVKKKHPEKLVRDKIVKYLEGVGAFVMNTPAGLVTKDDRTFSVGESGRADLHVCLRGRFIAVETKAKGKQPTEAQRKYGARVEQAGGIYIVADCVDDVTQITDNLSSIC
jgi:hypothetical protein